MTKVITFLLFTEIVCLQVDINNLLVYIYMTLSRQKLSVIYIFPRSALG